MFIFVGSDMFECYFIFKWARQNDVEKFTLDSIWQQIKNCWFIFFMIKLNEHWQLQIHQKPFKIQINQHFYRVILKCLAVAICSRGVKRPYLEQKGTINVIWLIERNIFIFAKNKFWLASVIKSLHYSNKMRLINATMRSNQIN